MPYVPSEEMPPLFQYIGALKVSRKSVARLADIQEMVLCRAASGERDLTWPEFKVIREVVDGLIEIKLRAGDAPIDWSDVGSIRKLLNDLHAENSSPPEPLTLEESALLSQFAQGVPLEQLAEEVRLDRKEALERIGVLLARTNKIAKAAARQ